METGLSRRCIPLGNEPGSPTPGGSSRPGKDLLDSLLAKGVVYADIRCHGLLKKEVKYLYLNDVISRGELMGYLKKIGISRATVYRRIKKLEERLDGAPVPALFAFANPKKYELFLYMARNPDKGKGWGDNDHSSVEDIAKELSVSSKYIRKLMKKCKIDSKRGRLSMDEVKHLLTLVLIKRTKEIKRDWKGIERVLLLLKMAEKAQGTRKTEMGLLYAEFEKVGEKAQSFFTKVVRG